MEKIVVVNDSATFKAEIDKARLTVVHFWASWAAQVSQPISIHTKMVFDSIRDNYFHVTELLTFIF